MKTTTLSAAMAALMASATAFAGDADVGVNAGANADLRSPGFVQLDANGNGALEQDEVRADSRLEANWNDLDRNDDGTVSQSEFSAFESDRMEERADQIEDRAEDRAEKMEDRADELEDRADDRK